MTWLTCFYIFPPKSLCFSSIGLILVILIEETVVVGQEERKVKPFIFDVFLIVFFDLAAFGLALAPFKFFVSLKERGSQDKRSFL